jgi:copper chaperone NosL
MVTIRESRRDRWKRWTVLALAMLAVSFYVIAYFQPMWGFYLHSPQYPNGLVLSIHLNGVVGDIDEINTLNHYIGMSHLDDAAKLARALSAYGVCGIGLVTMLLVVFPGRRYARYFAWPAMAFPVTFMGMTYYWMYTFGHHLNPAAPIHVEPFTPTLLGGGMIGNFHTTGLPGAGFYLIMASAIVVAVAFWLRRDVCQTCPHAAQCGLVCPHLFIMDPKWAPPPSPADKP